jgi:hypothetical protein
MAKNKFIGLRTLKTVFAVFITLIIDKFSSALDLFIMASTAIISLKPTKEKTILIGIERILGTIIGGILSLTLLYAKDYIGAEVHFPKGNVSSAPIKFDGAIFDDKDWFSYYKKYHTNKDQSALD